MKQRWMSGMGRLEGYLGRAGIQAAVRNSGWLIVDKITRMGMGLFVGLWVARYLGPADYGLMGYAFSVFGLVGIVAGLGLDGVIGRFLVRYPSRCADILGTAIVARCVSGLVVFVTFSSWIYWGQTQLPVIPGLVLAVGFLVQPLNVIRYWFDSKLASKQLVIVESVAFVVTSIVKVILILNDARVDWFIGISTVEVGLGILGFTWVYFQNGTGIRWRFSPTIGKLILRAGLPLTLAGSAIMVYMRIDQVMLTMMSGTFEAGTYGAAARLSEVWAFLPALIATSATPSIIQCKKLNPALYLDRIGRLMSILTALAYGLIAATIATGWWLVPTVLGPQYAGSTPILGVHILGAVGIFQGAASAIYYVNEKLTKIFALNLGMVAIANVALNFLLIPRLGGMGAAIATVISYTVVTVATNLCFKQTRPLFKLQMDGLRLKNIF
jgi:PST family polysaccharide transporter